LVHDGVQTNCQQEPVSNTKQLAFQQRAILVTQQARRIWTQPNFFYVSPPRHAEIWTAFCCWNRFNKHNRFSIWNV